MSTYSWMRRQHELGITRMWSGARPVTSCTFCGLTTPGDNARFIGSGHGAYTGVVFAPLRSDNDRMLDVGYRYHGPLCQRRGTAPGAPS